MSVPIFTFKAIGVDETGKTLQQWGFTDPVLEINSQTASELRMRVPGVNIGAQSIIPYFTRCQLFRNIGAGPIKIFEGRQVTDRRSARAKSPNDAFSFLDAWHELSLTPFQQIWSYRPSAASPVITKRFSRYNLFQNITTGALMTNGEQITEVLTYAITLCGVNLQIGVIEPSVNLPIVPARAMVCSEVIYSALKPSPDAVAYIDYATNPPTFHVRLRRKPDNSTTLIPITMPFGGDLNGVRHQSSEISTRYDLLVDQVVLDYKKSVSLSINGATQSWTNFDTDAYPAGSTGESPGAIVLPIDLQGAFVNKLQGTVTAAAFSTADLNFWKQKHHPFSDDRVVAGSLVQIVDSKHTVEVKDEQGNNIDLVQYPNEHTNGTINPWMQLPGAVPVREISATVKAWFRWNEVDANGFNIKQHNDSQVTVRVKLTNSPVGDTTYETTTSSDTGELEPVGLAQNIWQSLQQLQYEGEHTIKERYPSDPMAIVGPWNLLNLTGGLVEWSTMNASIQSVTHDFFGGVTEIRFGPAAHIATGDKVQLMLWARWRLVTESPNVRISGQTSGSGGAVEVGRDAPKENTTSGLSTPKFQAVTLYNPVLDQNQNISHDAVGHEVQINSISNGSKQPDWSKGGFSLKVSECLCSDGQKRKVYTQELPWYDDSCNLMHRLVVCSDPF